MLPAAFIVAWKREAARLIAEYPEMADDPILLSDTLESILDPQEIIGGMLRAALDKKAHASGLAGLIEERQARKARLERGAEAIRASAMNIMNEIGMRKIAAPDFTASIRSVPPKVEIEDEAALPDALVITKVVRTPDRVAIKEALSQGPVEGARLSNGGETITIRTS